jgi:2-polyprenyl-6-methoxyphenol hydroxylase-like FAD-dependent oxidoreductase
VRQLAVAIIGCGTAGPASALLLSEAGHHVTLFERVANPGPIGAGIVLQPSGMSVLLRLGLLDPILEAGAPLDELYAETPSRKRVVHLRYRDLSPTLFGLGLHRGALFETLMAKVKATPQIDLQLGVEARAVKRDRREPVPRGEGEKVFLEDSEKSRHGPFDLILVCDGARSHLIDPLMPKRRVTKYPWGALWFVGKIEDEKNRRLYQVVKGTHRLVGLLPSGRAPGSSARVASLFWSIRLDTVDAFRAGKIDLWKQEVLSYIPEAAPLLDQINSFEDLLVAEYHDVRMPHWHGENVVWLGDAAHATSPQLGQGCNLALVDAMELADCLDRNDHVSIALAEYSRRRRAHLTYYQFMTRALTPFFQSDLRWLGPLRDLLFGLTCRLPIVGKQMLLGMAGIHRGPFRSTMPLGNLPPRRD